MKKSINPSQSSALDRASQSDRSRDAPRELRWESAAYVPLPPSPPPWEVDGRDEFNRLYRDPVTGPVLQASFRKQHAKVIKLSAALSPEERAGAIGAAIARAYRRMVAQRMKARQHAAAAKQYAEMFERVPGDVESKDRRHFNNILAEMDRLGRRHDFERIADVNEPPLFMLSDALGCWLEDVRALEPDERPDVDARVLAHGVGGSWMLSRMPTETQSDERCHVLRRFDPSGRGAAEITIRHDVYRVGASSGPSLAVMDSAGVLRVYDKRLDLVLDCPLRSDPRVVDHLRANETNYWGQFKSQVRAIDVAPDGNRYLFTLADEAWVCGFDGRALWGVRMPLKDGWERVVTRSKQTGVAREVVQALRLLELALPVEADDIRRQYRKLIFAHHPDRNPGDPTAETKTKDLGRAFEILTGIDPASLELGDESVTSFVRTRPDMVIEAHGLRLSITLPTGSPQDWVYGATFATADGGVYLATYSGRVILVSSGGAPVVVFDVGTCPSEIVEVGRYLYLLTHTRLYVIEDRRRLAAFLDVFKQGRLFATERGFGLVTTDRLQWFAPNGAKQTELHSRDPIRAVHETDGGLVVKTRRNAVTIRGLPTSGS